MAERAFHRRVMAGEDAWSLPLRGVLRVLSTAYGAVIAVRNRRYDRGRDVVSVEVPVLSVGNLTTGGTGKTPLVIDLVRRLQGRGRRVAVLSRGYLAAPGQQADELLLVSLRAPGAVCIADPDRARAAARAVREHDIDAIVLDDAFQHRRLARDLDVVAVDATRPFGYGHLLPRGMLREPVTSLRRAHLIVITRCDQVSSAAQAAVRARLAGVAPQVPVVACRHRPAGLVQLDGHPADGLRDRGRPAFCFSAIGNPEAFERTAGEMNAELRGHLRLPDHHQYGTRDLIRIADAARDAGAELVLTTEKDAVKVSRLPFDWPLPALAVRIEIDFLEQGDTIVSSAVERALGERRGSHAQAPL